MWNVNCIRRWWKVTLPGGGAWLENLLLSAYFLDLLTCWNSVPCPGIQIRLDGVLGDWLSNSMFKAINNHDSSLSHLYLFSWKTDSLKIELSFAELFQGKLV